MQIHTQRLNFQPLEQCRYKEERRSSIFFSEDIAGDKFRPFFISSSISPSNFSRAGDIDGSLAVVFINKVYASAKFTSIRNCFKQKTAIQRF